MELPLFPLPNLVLFPRTVIPLHIFEPRYKQMIEDLKKLPEENRMIILATMEDPIDVNEFGHENVNTKATVAKVIFIEDGENETYNIMILGLFSGTVNEIPFEQVTKPYRRANITIREEVWDIKPDGYYHQKLKKLMYLVSKQSKIKELNLDNITLKELVPLICHCLPFETTVKLKLLDKISIKERVILIFSKLSLDMTYSEFEAKNEPLALN